MAHIPTRTSRILPLEIPLSSQPRDYRPGDGPALAPVRLCLENDASAFIVDKRVLAGEPINGELKLELYYVVGWPDLPAARVAILATKILDYVSPRTLEDWEYKCLLEKDEEQEKEEAALRRKQEERARAQAASALATGTSTPSSSTPGQKKRGRPSKAEVLARHIAQQASFGDDELANVPLPSASMNGPSLSTPQKSLSQAVTYMDIDETDTNDAISRQLQGGSGSESDNGSQMDEELVDVDEANEIITPDTDTVFTSLDSFLPAHSSRGYAESPTPNPLTSTQQDPTQSILPVPIFSLHSNSKNSQVSRRKTQLTTPVPVPSYPRQAGKKPSVPSKKMTPVPPPPLPLSRVKVSRQAHAVTVTPIPAPLYPAPKPKPPRVLHKPKSTPIPPPPYPAPASKPPRVQHEAKLTPIPPPTHPPLRESSTNLEPKKPPKVTYTPIPPPPLPPPGPSKKPHQITCTPIPPPPPFVGDGGTASRKWAGFTPAGHSPRNQATKGEAEAEDDSNDRHNTPSRGATPGQKNRGFHKRKRSQLEEEKVWEVKKLEDDKVVEVNGELVRHFKVRWKGKWPPGQNPTWEPEEYISEPLVTRYLKDKAAKVVQNGSSPKKPKKSTPVLKTKYSSVAEAFEGEDDDLPMLSSSSLLGDAQNEEDDDEDEHFQVTEQTRQNTPFHKPRIDQALIAELAASFA